MATPALHIFRSPQAAASLLHPIRQQILRQLRQPGSATTVAQTIGLPRQQVNYHLRALEEAGAVTFVEERRKGNCNERIVRAVATSYLISPEALGELGPDPATRRDRFSLSYLVSIAARTIRELALLSVRAAGAGKRLATLTLETEIRFRTAEDRNRFAEEAANTLAAIAAKYHDAHAPAGRSFRVLLSAYPLITRHTTEPDQPPDATID